VPPAPGTGTGLPPALPPGFDTPATTTGGGATTPATTTPPATAATSTSFLPATNTTGGGYAQIPAPGSCTTPPPTPLQGGGAPGKDPIQAGGAPGKDPIQGGGAAGGLAPILSQLTGIIGQLSTAVGGVSGGGAPGKTPVQGGGAAPTTPPPGSVAGASGGGAAPAPSTVAGANGAAGANAAQGATQVQGGGGAAPQDMSAIVAALKGLVETLTQLIAALGGSTTGGGPGQMPPGKDVAPPKGDVKGDHGHGDPTQAPPKGEVKGDNGPGQKTPEQKGGPTPPPVTPPPVTPPPVTPPPATPPTQVAGDNGGPVQQSPVQSPIQAPPPKVEPPKVDGANGGPVQQTPVQTPVQTPPTKGPVVIKGNVVLDNDDERWSAKLTANGGKAENSVELWGDPHVVITTEGKAEKFDIGYGAGKVTLFDGTVVSWDTYDKGKDHQFILRDFKVNSPGSQFDRSVTTRDRDGNKGDQMGLTTALTDAHLKELAIALRTMKGPMSDPLKNGTWLSPAYQKPTQGGGVVQQTAVGGVQQGGVVQQA
jgi:hypothetical protein